MALTRKALKAMGLTDEQVESIVEMHTETVDALKEQRDQYKTELEDAKANSNSEYEEKYNAEHEAFEQYKSEITAKETRAAKLNAGRAILKDAGVPENRIETLMRAYDVDAIELDEHGAATDVEARVAKAKTDFASFIPTTTETGVKTATPPSTRQGAKDPGQMTMAEYIKYRKGE